MDQTISSSDSGSTIIVQPIPGYVVKTRTSNGKLFVNVCHSEMIDAPTCVDTGSIRFPLSVGAVFQDIDKSGQSCDVIDVVVSGSIINESMSVPETRETFHSFIRDSIEQKHGIQILSEFRVIKKNYVGEKVRPQRVRVPRSSLIEELPSTAIQGLQNSTAQTPSFSFSYWNESRNACIDVLKLPHVSSTEKSLQEDMKREFTGETESNQDTMSHEEALKDMNHFVLILEGVLNPSLYRLRVSNQRLYVSKSGMNRCDFHIWFPKVMDSSTAHAQFKESEKSIVLTMRV